ncbi:MAG: DUF58 domain-containing protein [Planctomycetota bacterium]
MRLTRFGFYGFVFYVVMFGAFFASPYSNLFFLLLAFLTLLFGGGTVAAFRNLRGVEASIEELAPVPTDAAEPLVVRVRAPRPARFQLVARLRLGGGHELTGHLDLLDGEGQLGVDVAGLPRGCYSIEAAWLESMHPFGLIRRRRELAASGELAVYPSPRSLLEGRSAAEALDDLLGGDHAAGEAQPSGLRDHRDGDGLRRVHWRASARRGRLVVQEWEGAGGNGLEVVLDRRCEPDELEQALASISAMVQLARTNKETLRLHSQDVSATFGEGQRPFAEALRFLAGAQALPASAPPPPAVSPSVARLPRALSHV